MEILGIDIGGSGIKGAIVDTAKGEFISERHRIETPQPATPEAVTDVVKELVDHFKFNGAIGCTFPAIMKHGVAHSAANVHESFVGTDVQRLIQRKTGNATYVLNDADAAGIAEMRFGAGRDNQGLVIMITLGTGIGSAVFMNGILVPNTEFGHLYLDKRKGIEAEEYASDRIRQTEDLNWEKWGRRVNYFLQHIEFIFSPDLIIIGGGVSKESEKFFPFIELAAPLVPAQLLNQAGIVGAAIAAEALS